MARMLVAEFIYPDWGDEVNSGIGLSYRPCGPSANVVICGFPYLRTIYFLHLRISDLQTTYFFAIFGFAIGGPK